MNHVNGNTVKLLGRAFIGADILAITGLHIGGSSAAISIGGVDNSVIRHPITNQPYIPGSSLKGKMRSLTEKALGLPQRPLVRGRVDIHWCDTPEEYANCAVCHLYGLASEKDFGLPTRLLFRDVPLSDASAEELLRAKTDLPYTEVKYEASIDRVTSAANPRPLERVPAGAVFGPAEIVFSFYDSRDLDRFTTLLEGMHMLEDDYLGGSGTRGSGKVRFQNIRLSCKPGSAYAHADGEPEVRSFGSVQKLLAELPSVSQWLAQQLEMEG